MSEAERTERAAEVPLPYAEWFGADAFDATYGYDEATLRDVGAPGEPPGFERFWTDLYARARAVATRPMLTPAGTSHGFEVFDVELTSLSGVRLGGWVLLPADGVIDRALVISHGYGGREAIDPAEVPPNTAAIFPVARGLPTRSELPGVPTAGADHVLHGIDSVETYIHGGCAADVWCAASALLEILPTPPPRLGYVGGSFGGGIGALALPWDDRFDAGVLRVPSFGNHDLRLTMPCTGSGESVRHYVAARPQTREVLRFFDAATAARRIRIPMLLAPARWDPSVPPPGQFAVCNAVSGSTRFVVLDAGHVEYPSQADDDARYLAALHEFFA